MIAAWIQAHLYALIISGIALLVMAYIWVQFGVQLRKFNREVWAELQKCVWPWDPEQKGMKKYRELRDSTLVVVVSTLLLAGYVTFMDLVLNTIVGLITRYH